MTFRTELHRLSAVCLAACLLGAPAAMAQTAAPAADEALPPPQFGPRVQQDQGPGQQDPGQGQQDPGQGEAQRPPKEIGKFGNWIVQCDDLGDAKPDPAAPKPCGMVQNAKNEKNPQAGMLVVLAKMAQGGKTTTMMRLVAPIGVFLPTGIALEIDSNAVGRIPFTRCIPQACIAFAELTPDMMEKLRKGTSANFIIYEAPGAGLPIKVTLEGFSKGLEVLMKQ